MLAIAIAARTIYLNEKYILRIFGKIYKPF
jgi:hypothetical protein